MVSVIPLILFQFKRINIKMITSFISLGVKFVSDKIRASYSGYAGDVPTQGTLRVKKGVE